MVVIWIEPPPPAEVPGGGGFATPRDARPKAPTGATAPEPRGAANGPVTRGRKAPASGTKRSG